jgi:hypothetical protein
MVISSAAVFVLAATVTRIRCNVNDYNGKRKEFPGRGALPGVGVYG